MKNRQRAGLAILLYMLCTLQLVDMLETKADEPFVMYAFLLLLAVALICTAFLVAD